MKILRGVLPFGSITFEVIVMYFQRLEDLRVDHDKTQFEIAQYLNMGRSVYWRYEKGVREIPTWAAVKLADYYGVSTDYLLGRTDTEKPYPPAKQK